MAHDDSDKKTSNREPLKAECRLAEIVQYSCEQEFSGEGQPKVHCWPIPRIFRICAGRPAVELTRYVTVDPNTGAVVIPPTTSQQLPKAKPWRDITRYDIPDKGREP